MNSLHGNHPKSYTPVILSQCDIMTVLEATRAWWRCQSTNCCSFCNPTFWTDASQQHSLSLST